MKMRKMLSGVYIVAFAFSRVWFLGRVLFIFDNVLCGGCDCFFYFMGEEVEVWRFRGVGRLGCGVYVVFVG